MNRYSSFVSHLARLSYSLIHQRPLPLLLTSSLHRSTPLIAHQLGKVVFMPLSSTSQAAPDEALKVNVDASGAFKRQASSFRDKISDEPGAKFPPEKYNGYVLLPHRLQERRGVTNHRTNYVAKKKKTLEAVTISTCRTGGMQLLLRQLLLERPTIFLTRFSHFFKLVSPWVRKKVYFVTSFSHKSNRVQRGKETS